MEAPDALGWTNERANRKWWFVPDMSDLGCRRKKKVKVMPSGREQRRRSTCRRGKEDGEAAYNVVVEGSQSESRPESM